MKRIQQSKTSSFCKLTYPVNPTLYYVTPTAFTPRPPFCLVPTSQPLPLQTNQASHAQPSPIQRPVAVPTRACPPNPIPPSTLTPVQPSWGDLSEELATANQTDELPTLLPKPNKGKGKGKGKPTNKTKGGKGNKHRHGLNNSWSYDCYGSAWYWH